jgi:nucleotide-binding universal stress UspA family protein
MFKRIMAPVDLAHKESLEKALKATGDIAKHYNAPVTYVGVAASAPGALGHNPKEFGEKLSAFAAGQAEEYGITADSRPVISHDPSVDLDHALMKAADEMGADLVVMASHVPGLADYAWPPHGGRIAAHAHASVFVVRPD